MSMNNPYRNRPARPRVDSTTVQNNYGVLNNNSWPNAMASNHHVGPPPIYNNNAYQYPQHYVVNQEPQTSIVHGGDDGSSQDDSWNWDTSNIDSNNDSWNWSIDQMNDPLLIQSPEEPSFPSQKSLLNIQQPQQLQPPLQQQQLQQQPLQPQQLQHQEQQLQQQPSLQQQQLQQPPLQQQQLQHQEQQLQQPPPPLQQQQPSLQQQQLQQPLLQQQQQLQQLQHQEQQQLQQLHQQEQQQQQQQQEPLQLQHQSAEPEPGILESFQTDPQYLPVSSSGFDQWYNQSASVPAPSLIHYEDKNQLQPQPQLPVPTQLEPQRPIIAENQEHIQTVIGQIDSLQIDYSKSHDVTAKISTPETLQVIDSDVNLVKSIQEPVQTELPKQLTDNYEFASNDRNTFLETGELTDSHQENNLMIPNQEDDNDEIANDIPFLREVPGQSSSVNPQRNSPSGRDQLYSQPIPRLPDLRRNEPFGHNSTPERTEFRNIPPGQETQKNTTLPRENDILERRNDPSGRERSLPPGQTRNDPSGEIRIEPQQSLIETIDSDNNNENGHNNLSSDASHQSRQIPGELYINEIATVYTETSRIVTGSQSTDIHGKQLNETCKKREEAIGASISEEKIVPSSPKRRNSYIDRDDESDNSQNDEINEHKKDQSSPINSSRYEYEKKMDRSYYERDRDRERERDREVDDDFYYERSRNDYDIRSYNSRDDLDRSEPIFRENERRHRDGTERVLREDGRGRHKDEHERSLRRRDEQLRERRRDESRRQKEITVRDYESSRYSRSRDYSDHERRRDDRRRYDDYDLRDSRRDYCDDGYSRSSRPSSRSSYNDRDRERDYYMRSRDHYYGYNNYGIGGGGGPVVGGNAYEYNSNYYAYLENLRRTNPVAYAEWYHKYYSNQHQHHHQQRQHHQQQQQQQQQQLITSHDMTNYREDRGSVHSGRSSCDERNTSGKQTLSELSMIDDFKNTSRMTPTKFSTSHGQGTFSIGSLLHVHASYPAEGERARIDLHQINGLLSHDPIVRNLRTHPGPLIKGVTHKKTIIEYCENQIRKASLNNDLDDPASYILIYQLMVMLIQQNGNVVGVDIATLLLKNKEAYPYYVDKSIRRESVVSQRSSETGVDESASNLENDVQVTIKQRKTIEQLTEEFRNTLLYGLVQDALEFAMTEGLWGHALFLASKLDKRTHASVMARFANSLSIQDPLQTLYQLHSGRIPTSVTCVADSKWDDWRPHLAMIISNTSANPEINCRSIIVLGDTLAARGNIYAAHFCYILAQIDFGMYENSNDKLVLIGANNNQHQKITDFANPEAIMLTEIYEYARNLSEPGFTIVGLQSFKFEIVKKLIDYGFLEKALLYLEQISMNIISAPEKYKHSFINEVYAMSERIKFHDPIFKDSTIGDDTSLTWLCSLADIVDKSLTNGSIQENNYHDDRETVKNIQTEEQQQQQQWNYDNTSLPTIEPPMVDVPNEQWIPLSQPSVQDTSPSNENIQQSTNQHSDYYNDYGQQQMDNQISGSYNQTQQSLNSYDGTSWQQQQQSNQWSYQQPDDDSMQEQAATANYEHQPQISMGPSSNKQYDPLEELESLDQPKTADRPTPESPAKSADKPIDKKAPTSRSAAGSGASSGGGGGGVSAGSWFGDLFSKLALKPKNQMILPDDNNPAIVWDSVAKKWTNKDDDGDSSSQQLTAPPKTRDMGGSVQPGPTLNSVVGQEFPTQNNLKTPTTSGNMFKLQKGRSMRANYVDIMNPGGVKSNGGNSISPNILTTPMAASSPQFFIPAPINNTNSPVDFLTSTSHPIPTEDSNMANDVHRSS